MKPLKFRSFLLAMMLCALCVTQASALEYTFDAPDILRFALEPEPAVRGSWGMWGLGLLLSVLCGLQTAFPLAFFYLRHALAVEDPEPTEFYLFMQRAGSVVAAAAVFGLYLYGLTLQTPL